MMRSTVLGVVSGLTAVGTRRVPAGRMLFTARRRVEMSNEEMVRVEPPAAIPGGEVSVECEAYDTSNLRECRVTFDGAEGRMVGAAPWRVLALVPETLEASGEVDVSLEDPASARYRSDL